MRILSRAGRNAAQFLGGGGESLLLVRWLFLRLVGGIYFIVFAGIAREGQALVGPQGIAPAADYCSAIAKLVPGVLERMLLVPSLFWLGAGAGAVSVLTGVGLVAALALILNLWPRGSLLACWLAFLSFVATWQLATSSIVDQLMLEVALLSIPFAPRGWRPGLGAASPPRPIAIFAVRWLLLRLMLTSGLIKLTGIDPHWRQFSAMAVMFETSPLPTYLGFVAHHLPRWFQVLEILLTFGAELVAPLLAVFGGIRARWLALALWAALQGGIQLTGTFGWLNTAALALGLLLLNDAMAAAALRRLRRRRPVPAAPAGPPAPPPRWARYGLRLFLGLQFGVALYYSVLAVGGPRVSAALEPATRSVDLVFREFNSANGYVPYGAFPSAKYEIEFQGSNDGGKTWRSFPFRFKPQRVDRICGFIAPWLPRFETSLQLIARLPECPLVPRVAALLIARDREVMELFAGDPFPDRPPTIVEMPVYKFTFSSLAAYRATGAFWKKEYEGDYLPPVYVDPKGHITE